MADLTDLQASQAVKIAGASSSGSETNFVDATSAGALHTNLRNNAGTEIATAANPVRVDPTGTTTQPISATSLPLPTGAATAALQTQPGVDIGDVTINNASGASAVNIQDGGNSITIDATSLPLPTGAATAANQTTEISSLSSIDTKLTTTNSSLSSIDAGIPAALGQTTMAASMPVTIASNQSTLPISAASLPLPTGAATSALQTQPGVDIGDVTINNAAGAAAVNIQDGGNSITVDGSVTVTQATGTNLHVVVDSSALPTGAATEATLVKLPLAQGSTTSGQSGVLEQGAVTTAAPTYTTGQTSPLSLNTSGGLRVDGSGVSQPIIVTDISPATGSITAQDTATITLVGANSQNFYSGTPTANSAVSFALSSIESVNIEASLLGGGGTMVIDVSTDGGTFWFRPNIFQVGTSNYTNSFTAPFSVTVNVSGMTNVRVRAISAWTGSATILVKETLNTRTVIVTDSNLPVGASTAANQVTANASLSSIDAGIPTALGAATTANSMPVNIASDQVVPISASALPLPSGASTSANQSTIITSIQLLDDVPTAQNGAFVKGDPIMGQLDDTSTVVATEDNVAVVRITPQRAIHTNLRTVAGVESGTTASPLGARISDGTDTVGVTANGDLKVADGLRGGGVFKELSIPTSGTAVEVKVGASRLTNRKFITVTPITTGLWWGYDNTVTIANGVPLANGQFITFACDPDSTFQIWLVGNANTRLARITEST